MNAGSHPPGALVRHQRTAGPGDPPTGAGCVQRRHPQWGGAVREERPRPTFCSSSVGAEFVNSAAVADGVMASVRAWPDHPEWIREFLQILHATSPSI
ncbi:MAG: hypothetical protein ACRDRP_17845 [Pseudonocardiaceae bacterium]